MASGRLRLHGGSCRELACFGHMGQRKLPRKSIRQRCQQQPPNIRLISTVNLRWASKITSRVPSRRLLLAQAACGSDAADVIHSSC